MIGFFALTIIPIVFLISATLKFNGLINNPYDGVMSSPKIGFFLVMLEYVLAFLIISRYKLTKTLMVAKAFFAAGAFFSLGLITLEAPSCGCFGSMEVSPWWTLILNATSFLCLSFHKTKECAKERLGSVCKGFCLGAILVCTLGIGIYDALPNAEVIIKTIRGDELVMSSHIDLGSYPVGTIKVIDVPIQNNTNRPITIFAANTTCKCGVAQSLPVVIPPFSVKEIPVKVSFSNGRGVFSSYITMYTDGKPRTISVKLIGKINSEGNPL